jgi:hypothetical protein
MPGIAAPNERRRSFGFTRRAFAPETSFMKDLQF